MYRHVMALKNKLQLLGKAAVAGDQSVSNFIGTADGVKPFGKYGIVSFVYSFEVLQDCDLSDVFTFNTDIAGTEFEPYYRTSLDGTGEPNNTNAVNPELFLITHDDTHSTFANCALICFTEHIRRIRSTC